MTETQRAEKIMPRVHVENVGAAFSLVLGILLS
jgi:hypothetical protein